MGWPDQRWTPARIRELIDARFGVWCTIPGTWYLLRRRGWTCQMGARRGTEHDDGAVEVWRKEKACGPASSAAPSQRHLRRLRPPAAGHQDRAEQNPVPA